MFRFPVRQLPGVTFVEIPIMEIKKHITVNKVWLPYSLVTVPS